MKNLKKILALAVAFVMCFTMFAGAAVFTDVTPGGDYSQAITFLSDLGVIAGKPDGTFGINDAITRADAACLIARLMTGQTNPPKNDGTVQFTDVPAGSYYESSVGYCVALGITVGTGNGQYSPSRTITDGEFIAMLTRAMGYDTAEHPLAFPMGNITTAQQRGLLYGVNVDYASDALRGEDAQMLYNAMFAEYDRAAANKNTFQAADDHWDVTIAEEIFGLGRLSHDSGDWGDASFIGPQGTDVSFHGANRNNNPAVSCDAHTWVIAGVDSRYKENTYVAFAIDDAEEKVIAPGKTITPGGLGANGDPDYWSYQEFTYDGDISDLIGYRVELWGEYDHSGSVWDVEAIKVVDGSLGTARASTSAFQSRYGSNQAMYTYTPDMYTDDDKVVIDGKTLYLDDTNRNNLTFDGRASVAKINLDIDTADRWMWRIEDTAMNPSGLAAYDAGFSTFINVFARTAFLPAGAGAVREPQYTRNTDAYRIGRAYARTDRNQLNNTDVNINFADGDQYKLFDWDGDDYIDFVVVDTAKYAEVVTKTASRMVIEADDRNINSTTGVRTRGQYSLKLDDDNLKVEGADGVEEGDVIEITVVSRVYNRQDGEVVTIKVAKVDPEVKKLEKINITRQEYTFDGEVVTLADEDLFDVVEMRENGQSIEELNTIENIGKEFNLWFDRNGFLIKARVSDDTASGYLMILETVDGQDNLHTNLTSSKRGLAVADVLFGDNSIGEEVEFVRNLTIDGENDGSTGYNASTRGWNERKVVGNAYKYYMNEDKQITRLRSMTQYQASDYSFDESKDRLSASGTVNTNNSDAVVSNRTYGFDDDAVIFAVKPVESLNGNVRSDNTANNIGTHFANFKSYVRAQPHENNNSNVGQGSDLHYWVDRNDVMAVSIDDVPEIDNRYNTLNTPAPVNNSQAQPITYDSVQWRIPNTEVTHPARFLTWDLDGTVASGAAGNASTFKYMIAGNNRSGWMSGLMSTPVGSWNISSTVYTNMQTNAPIDDATTTPSAAFALNRSDDIEAAILGVENFDFYGSSSVKLALISNVYASGTNQFTFKAAIDGEYKEFTTVKDYDYNIFKGRLNSLNAMRSYLNQNSDVYTGERNALYAEVTMTSDGLIKEVRAMDVVDPATSTTYWDGDVARAMYMEGNVYRVVRGVTTQLLGKNLVTWQTNAVAANGTAANNGDRLYTLDQNNDGNAYDHLEASYDEDTDFYYIDQLPVLIQNQPVVSTQGFVDDIDGDISVRDSGVLNKSLFNTQEDGVQYFVVDYAVYKSDIGRMAAAFAFDDITRARNVTIRAINDQNIRVTKTEDADGARDAQRKFTINSVSGGTGVVKADLEITLSAGGPVAVRNIELPNGQINVAAKAVSDAVNADAAAAAANVTASFKENEVTIICNGANIDRIVFTNVGAEDLKYTVGANEPAVAGVNAKATITVAEGTYYLEQDTTITIDGNNGLLDTAGAVVVPLAVAGSPMEAADVVDAIQTQLNARYGAGNVTRDGLKLTIEDTTLNTPNDRMDITVTTNP